MTQACKTCKHLDVKPNVAGRIIVRESAYKCRAPIPEMPPLPDAVTKQPGFRDVWSGGYVIITMGTACPLYIKREKK